MTALGIASGLVAALCFGIGDFVAQGITRQMGWLSALCRLHLVGAIMVGLLAAGLAPLPMIELGVLLDMLLVILLGAVGAIGLYRAFESGVLSIVSPIAGSFAAVTVVLAIVFGRSPSGGVLLGLCVTLGGIVLASIPSRLGEHDGWRSADGVGWALLSSLGFGAMFFVLERVTVALGPFWPVAVQRAGVAILVGLVGSRFARPLRMTAALWTRIAVVALLDSTGLVVYSWGTTMAHVAVVAVLASLFAAVTVVLAQVRLRERLARWQWLGIAAILTGVASVTLLAAS